MRYNTFAVYETALGSHKNDNRRLYSLNCTENGKLVRVVDKENIGKLILVQQFALDK